MKKKRILLTVEVEPEVKKQIRQLCVDLDIFRASRTRTLLKKPAVDVFEALGAVRWGNRSQITK
jgi:hypothetical protein